MVTGASAIITDTITSGGLFSNVNSFDARCASRFRSPKIRQTRRVTSKVRRFSIVLENCG